MGGKGGKELSWISNTVSEAEQGELGHCKLCCKCKCAGFLLPGDEPRRPPAPASHMPTPPHSCTPFPSPSLCPPSSLLFLGLQGLGSHPSTENQDLKLDKPAGGGARCTVTPQSGSRRRGWRQPPAWGPGSR